MSSEGGGDVLVLSACSVASTLTLSIGSEVLRESVPVVEADPPTGRITFKMSSFQPGNSVFIVLDPVLRQRLSTLQGQLLQLVKADRCSKCPVFIDPLQSRKS